MLDGNDSALTININVHNLLLGINQNIEYNEKEDYALSEQSLTAPFVEAACERYALKTGLSSMSGGKIK